jgi:hypothetical protein
MELVLPDARPVFSRTAILTIALPVITGVCSLIYKLLTMYVFTTVSDEEAKTGGNSTAFAGNATNVNASASYAGCKEAVVATEEDSVRNDIIVVATLCVATLGYFYKSYTTFQRTKRTYVM